MQLKHWWSLMNFSGWRKSSVKGKTTCNWCYSDLCRSADLPTRQRYVALVESVRDNGGTIRIFSSLHLSGEREWLIVWIKGPISLFGFRKTQSINLTFHLGKLDIPHLASHSCNTERWGKPEIIPIKHPFAHHCFSLCAELGQLSGVAAILRFPLPDLEDSENDDSDG